MYSDNFTVNILRIQGFEGRMEYHFVSRIQTVTTFRTFNTDNRKFVAYYSLSNPISDPPSKKRKEEHTEIVKRSQKTQTVIKTKCIVLSQTTALFSYPN